MGESAKSHAPRWIIIGTAVLGLAAGALLVVSRVYEVQKARAEAARAQLEAEHRERELKVPPTQPAARPAPGSAPAPASTPPVVPPPAGNGPARPPLSDVDRLQGRWECVFEQIGGRDFTADELAAAGKTMTVAGDTMVIRRTQKGVTGEYRGTFVLRAEGGRTLFDLTGSAPGGGRAELLGVCAFQGEEFKICYRVRAADNPLRERAEGFATAPGTSLVYVRFRRTG